MADILNRSLAPVPDAAWSEIDALAAQRLRGSLSARKILSVDGPHGYETAALGTGRIRMIEGEPAYAAWGVREALPLIEARVSFSLRKQELESVARGAKDADLAPLEKAALRAALFEETLVYRGLPAAERPGLLEKAATEPVSLASTVEAFQQGIGEAKQALQAGGFGGPYALALGTKAYTPLNHALPSGRLLESVVAQMLGGPVVWSPALEGGVLVSQEDAYFELALGQDLGIGFAKETADEVEFFLLETLAFRVLEPAAAVELRLA